MIRPLTEISRALPMIIGMAQRCAGLASGVESPVFTGFISGILRLLGKSAAVVGCSVDRSFRAAWDDLESRQKYGPGI